MFDHVKASQEDGFGAGAPRGPSVYGLVVDIYNNYNALGVAKDITYVTMWFYSDGVRRYEFGHGDLRLWVKWGQEALAEGKK